MRVEAPQHMRPVGEAQRSIQMLMHCHLAARQRGSPPHPFQLQREILEAHSVVAIHRDPAPENWTIQNVSSPKPRRGERQ